MNLCTDDEPPTPVPIGESAKKADHKDHSGASELQTDIVRALG